MIEIEDAILIQGSPKEVFLILEEYPNWKEWWHIQPFMIEGEPKCIEFRPVPFIKVKWREMRKVENELIEFAYEKGPYAGKGIWRIASQGETVRVSYTIYLTPKNALFWLFSKTPFLKWKHSGDLQIILNNLKTKVEQRVGNKNLEN